MNMWNRSIYLKLYLGFMGIFLVTLIVVLLLAAQFYGTHLKNEVVEYSLSEARFLRDEFADNCGVAPGPQPLCRSFLNKMENLGLLRLWILDPRGAVLYSSRGVPQSLDPEDLERAKGGEEVMTFGRKEPPRVALPIHDAAGKVAGIIVLQRTGHRDRFPRFPLAFSLLIAGIVIAILVHPLSRRITRPLRELNALAGKWSDGHLQERVEIHGSDEIAELGRVFNGMADNLQKMLQQKKEFLALISHELKSPVARMKIASEILADRHGSHEDSASVIRGIQNDLEESEKMIEQLLLISRIEMDLPSAVQERVDLAEVARHAAAQAEAVARVRGISVEAAVTAVSSFVKGDSAELQRAITNILENAVKFSPDGKVVGMRVTLEGNNVRILVSDLGPGILPEDRERIFEPFFRGKNAGGREGSGLGLFLARRIVERHGGTISASENVPNGTIVTVTLPLTSR